MPQEICRCVLSGLVQELKHAICDPDYFYFLFYHPWCVNSSLCICDLMLARFSAKTPGLMFKARKGGGGGVGQFQNVLSCAFLWEKKKALPKAPQQTSPHVSLLWTMPPLAQEQLGKRQNFNDWLPWNNHISSLGAESIAKWDKLGFC